MSYNICRKGQEMSDLAKNHEYVKAAKKDNLGIGIEQADGSIVIYDRNGLEFDWVASFESATEMVKGVKPIGGRKPMRGLLRVRR